ncbi:basic membrane protein A [Rubricella aquisinus]|jgi:basic membrane protein A|uniref:Basic membrane protein A n=1 Tax=Rubricella aquisinus TaxID=2028108 RepID=A0A840WXG7_9RHOB|nr:BMP family ABC transporter substrate-binding protein [Rubricella aquisinus]MBB5515054.1 basic membrane protein A [Rubricella aquisinus]
MFKTLVAAAAASMVALAAYAQDINPAVVYDLGGRNDQSFNQAAFTGAERFKDETGIEYRDFEIQNDAQREQALRRFARNGHNPIIAIGFSHGSAVDKVAAEFPDTNFAIVDMVVDQPNVRSIVFKEHEGSFLVGMMAAMASETGTVGFVGGMDIPLIQRFQCGYAQGVKAANPDATVLANMTGTDGSAWNNPTRGSELTRAQIDAGADVVYHAAGGTGVGVLQAAADAGKLGIGVDSNQNGMHPGSVLTSMLKRVDNAVYNTFMDAMNGEFEPGFNVNGLAQRGVGFAVDENNAELLDDAMLAAVYQAAYDISTGAIVVHDVMSDGPCPF